MKAVFLNPFIKSVSQVMESMLFEAPQRGKPFVSEESVIRGNDVAIIIGLNGMLAGQVVLSLGDEAAKSMAARLLMEDRVAELDEDARSALAEIGNMVTANATIGLCDAGYSCDITPPSVLDGPRLQFFKMRNNKILVIPMQLSFGDVSLNLAIEETAAQVAAAAG